MKRLILMGGRPWLAEDGGKRFVETLFRYYPKKVKLAFCIFAQPEGDWDETERWNTGMFDKFKGKRALECQTMTPENFAEVSKWADVIYLPGGDPFVLKEIIAVAATSPNYGTAKLSLARVLGRTYFVLALFPSDSVHLARASAGSKPPASRTGARGVLRVLPPKTGTGPSANASSIYLTSLSYVSPKAILWSCRSDETSAGRDC